MHYQQYWQQQQQRRTSSGVSRVCPGSSNSFFTRPAAPAAAAFLGAAPPLAAAAAAAFLAAGCGLAACCCLPPSEAGLPAAATAAFLAPPPSLLRRLAAAPPSLLLRLAPAAAAAAAAALGAAALPFAVVPAACGQSEGQACEQVAQQSTAGRCCPAWLLRCLLHPPPPACCLSAHRLGRCTAATCGSKHARPAGWARVGAGLQPAVRGHRGRQSAGRARQRCHAATPLPHACAPAAMRAPSGLSSSSSDESSSSDSSSFLAAAAAAAAGPVRPASRLTGAGLSCAGFGGAAAAAAGCCSGLAAAGTAGAGAAAFSGLTATAAAATTGAPSCCGRRRAIMGTSSSLSLMAPEQWIAYNRPCTGRLAALQAAADGTGLHTGGPGLYGAASGVAAALLRAHEVMAEQASSGCCFFTLAPRLCSSDAWCSVGARAEQRELVLLQTGRSSSPAAAA